MKEKYRDEINIIHLMSFAPHGFTPFDLTLITKDSHGKMFHHERKDIINYGNWENILMCEDLTNQLLDENFQAPQLLNHKESFMSVCIDG